MEIDTEKIDDAILALLWLTLHDERRAWKNFDWDATDRLHRKGMIADPAASRSRWCSPTTACGGPRTCFARSLRSRNERPGLT